VAFLIDSDILIYSLQGKAPVNAHFQKYANAVKAVSIITYGELLYGAKKSGRPQKNLALVVRIGEIFPLVDVTRAVIEVFSDLKASLSKEGRILADMDLLIAATALSLNYALVTNNEKHFSRVPGLRLDNWTQPAMPE
jgi:tRNA(fMet)-specific endonuclease VapC